ncbi:hypothetical protein [Enterococcus dispar]
MLSKKNILEQIKSHEEQIQAIEDELKRAEELGLDIPDMMVFAKTELSYLQDNLYRYKMQAKAWGMIG